LSFIPIANAKSLLIDNENIWHELLQISVANKISEECTSIDARKIKGLFALLQIKSVAKELGYTDNEINEFVSSEENKKKLKNETDIYLLDNGVDLNNVKIICLFGHSEMDQETTIGSLLRIK
tara:strand:- start:35 stop:403 length:369 start_codon:yes stop_codon:yes gene_type:complete